MAISEQSRHELYSKLEAVLGADEAATLMEHLPPVGWADVATKRDLDVLATTLRGEVAELRGEVSGLRGDIHTDLAAMRSELEGKIVDVHRAMAAMRSELGGEIGGLRGEIGGLRGAVGAQGRNLFFQVLGLQFSSFALFLAARQVV